MLNINQFPRIPLSFLPTPFRELKRLSAFLEGPSLFVKRDDLTGLALGGNKTRKLEFLMGEALAQGCDLVITGGAMQSNHCRQTAAAAAVTGLECCLALGGEHPEDIEGNLLLDYLLGAEIHWCGAQRKGETLASLADTFKQHKHKPYIIPYGGSNAIGALGYVVAMQELKEQLTAANMQIDYIVFASSSGGTHAGITVGADICELRTKIIGIGIDKPTNAGSAYESRLAELANALAAKIEAPHSYTARNFTVKHEYAAAGYGVITFQEQEAIILAAQHEALLLDPVYTGRAFAGLIDMIRKGFFKKTDKVLFWHTGGTPALFEYENCVIAF